MNAKHGDWRCVWPLRVVADERHDWRVMKPGIVGIARALDPAHTRLPSSSQASKGRSSWASGTIS